MRATLARRGVDWQVETFAAELSTVASSLLHMFANRMFVGEARTQELVVYDFLLRYYRTQAALAKKTG